MPSYDAHSYCFFNANINNYMDIIFCMEMLSLYPATAYYIYTQRTVTKPEGSTALRELTIAALSLPYKLTSLAHALGTDSEPGMPCALARHPCPPSAHLHRRPLRRALQPTAHRPLHRASAYSTDAVDLTAATSTPPCPRHAIRRAPSFAASTLLDLPSVCRADSCCCPIHCCCCMLLLLSALLDLLNGSCVHLGNA